MGEGSGKLKRSSMDPLLGRASLAEPLDHRLEDATVNYRYV